MSSTASVPNSFANAVTATGAQLDANYTTIVAYLNDPTNRNNYAADGAATNTVVLTFSPPVVSGYTAGLDLCWKWGVTNTGAVQANANGLGLINVVNPDGSALQAGQGVAGSIGRGVYDGTRAIYLTPPSPASQAAMETATASASFVSPSMMRYHPAVPKAWCVIDGTAIGTTSVSVGFGITQSVRQGTGTYALTFQTPFSSANYAPIVSPINGGASGAAYALGRGTATVTVIAFATPTGAATDLGFIALSVFGDLP